MNMTMTTKKSRNPVTTKVTRLLKKIEPEISSITKFNIAREGAFRGVLKGSLVQSFEFTLYAQKLKPDESAVLAAAALRGICEDLIALKFLSQLSRMNRDQAIVEKHTLNTSISARKQQSFFKTYRPYQITFSFKDNERLKHITRTGSRNLAARRGFGVLRSRCQVSSRWHRK